MKTLMATETEWNSLSQVGEHYFARYLINEGHKIMWLLDYWHPLSWKVSRKDYFIRKFMLWRRGGAAITENLDSYAPFTLIPLARQCKLLDSIFVARHSIDLTFPNLLSYLRKKEWHKVDVLWIRNLKMAYLANKLSYEKLIYRMTDDIPAFPRAPESFRRMECDILKVADVVFLTSRNLYNYAKKYCNNVIYLPNGVDYDLFNSAELNEPDELKQIPHPRVIYVGSLAYIDMDLMTEVAKSMSHYSFVIIHGSPCREPKLSYFREARNIFMLGERTHSIIPSYLKNSDVGIIPFKKNRLTNSASPLKLYEYFAAGLPVVATNLKELRNIRSPAYLANSTSEFVNAILAAYKGGKDKPKFFDFAKNNTWSARYETLRKALNK